MPSKPIKVHIERWNDLVIARPAEQPADDPREIQFCREYGNLLVGRRLKKGEKVTGYIEFKESV